MSSSDPGDAVDPGELEKEAVTLSLKAIYFDENNIPETAAFYYVEAAEAILNAIKAGSKKPGFAQVSSYRSIQRKNEYFAIYDRHVHSGTPPKHISRDESNLCFIIIAIKIFLWIQV